jgi:hypothetical protein
MVGNTAGINHVHVSTISELRTNETMLSQLLANRTGFCKIELASQRVKSD